MYLPAVYFLPIKGSPDSSKALYKHGDHIYITGSIIRCCIENRFSKDCILTFDFKSSERKKYELRL